MIWIKKNQNKTTRKKRTIKKLHSFTHIQSESDSDDDDDALALDDFDAPAKFKVLKIHTPSMRTDAIISNSLDVSRRWVK